MNADNELVTCLEIWNRNINKSLSFSSKLENLKGIGNTIGS